MAQVLALGRGLGILFPSRVRRQELPERRSAAGGSGEHGRSRTALLAGLRAHTDGAAGQGMRPAVVLRGSKESYMAEVSVCYLLHFDRITTAGGAFQ